MRVTYDLAKSPVTYDFLGFLVRAERSRNGEPLEVVIKRGERNASLRDAAFSYERKQWRLSLLSQLPHLLPSVTSVTVGGEGTQTLEYGNLPDWEPVFRSTPGAAAAISEYVRFGKPFVTITLRQSDFQPERNSNLPEWEKVADWLRGHGYEVVFVPDTEAVLKGAGNGYIPASMSADIRLALYEHAHLNCFTGGGPFVLAMWSSAPVYCRKLHVAGITACEPEFLTQSGMAEGDYPDKFKWLRWGPDNADEIIGDLEPILSRCVDRMRPLVMPLTFSVLGEDQRKEHTRLAMARGLPTLKPVEPHGRTMILACYGPSLKETAAEIPLTIGDVFTVSGAHDFLVKMDVVPYAHVESDPRPHKVEMLNLPQDGTRYYIAGCCHPSMFDRLEGKQVTIWHPWNSQETDAQVAELDPEGFVVLGGSNTGLRAISIGYALGYRKIIIHGMDCSFSEQEQHAGKHTGKQQRRMQVHFPDGKSFWTSPSMLQGMEDFIQTLPSLSECLIGIKGNGLLQYRLAYGSNHQANS